MFKEKKYRIILIVQIIWFLLFITDVLLAKFFSFTLFSVSLKGGEIISCIGLGYIINFYYPLISIDDSSVYKTLSIHPWPYIIINIIIAVVLFVLAKKK